MLRTPAQSGSRANLSGRGIRRVAAAGLFFAVACSGCVPADRVWSVVERDGLVVERGTRRLDDGGRVGYALYLPEKATKEAPAPVVVLLHGFARSHRQHAGNAEAMAREGMAVLTPDMTTLMTGERGRRRNIRAVGGHLDWLEARNQRAGDRLEGRLDLGRIGLAGHSAGGAVALEFAAVAGPRKAALKGICLLDGVPWPSTLELRDAWPEIPLLSLRADPSPWNASGAIVAVEGIWPGEVRAEWLEGTSHIDPENPSGAFADWLLKASAPERRGDFLRRMREFLRERFEPDAG